jgi:hypothetical protein
MLTHLYNSFQMNRNCPHVWTIFTSHLSIHREFQPIIRSYHRAVKQKTPESGMPSTAYRLLQLNVTSLPSKFPQNSVSFRNPHPSHQIHHRQIMISRFPPPLIRMFSSRHRNEGDCRSLPQIYNAAIVPSLRTEGFRPYD